MKKTFCIFLLISTFITSHMAARLADGNFELIILHNNDMHGRFEETDEYTNQCKGSKCFGGFARTSTIIKDFREKAQKGGPKVLYLNAGDTYTGTPWFALYKENISIEFMNALLPDAMALGNHEFDYGIDGIIPFLNQIKFPVVAANIKAPSMTNIPMFKSTHIIDVDGISIGIIGYVTPETATLSLEKNVTFYNEIEIINKESRLLHEAGIEIIIALGHSGIERDLEIAEQCEFIDLVVGGHSHTYLGEKKGIEIPYGPYPMVVKQKNSGKKIPVVQAYAYTKYIGALKVKFDKNGNVKEASGQPILLDSSIEKDPSVHNLLEKYRGGIEELETKIVGHNTQFLDGHTCRYQECNLGNLLADAMLYQYAEQYSHTDGWSDVSISFIQSGGIRASVDANTNITQLTINTILPFSDRIIIQELTGSQLKDVLEWSVHRYVNYAVRGEFIQMSGMRVIYNISNPIGERVVYIEALCKSCFIPEYSEVLPEKKYRVIFNEYLYLGGDGFDMLKDIPNTQILNLIDSDNFANFVSRKGKIHAITENRIIFVDNEKHGSDITNSANLSSKFTFSTLLISILVTVIKTFRI